MQLTKIGRTHSRFRNARSICAISSRRSAYSTDLLSTTLSIRLVLSARNLHFR